MSRFFPDDAPPVVNHAIAQIERRLPGNGEVLVRVGSRVEPDDIIGRGQISSPPQLINVAGALDILPRDMARALRKEQGSKVLAGELIARVGMIGRRSCTSPVNGTITNIDHSTGYVAIEPDPQPIEVRAQVPGLVMDVSETQTITIETPSAAINGVAGIGSDRFGVLRLLVTDPSEVVEARQIEADSAYAIIIAGAGITAEALEKAVLEQVRGVIVGGMEAEELMKFLGERGGDLWRIGPNGWRFPLPDEDFDPGLTLVMTEGLGTRPMSRPIFDLLSEYHQQEALIQGGTRIRRPLVRPRLVIPLTRSRATAELDPPHPHLTVGGPVRLLDDQHLGHVGTVALLPEEPEMLPSGGRGFAAHIDLSDGERVVIARSAVEALG